MKRAKQSVDKVFDFEKHCGELGDAPRFRLLSDEKLERVHEASLEMLKNVGVRITTEPALQLLTDAGCTITSEDIVKIPPRPGQRVYDTTLMLYTCCCMSRPTIVDKR